MARGRMISCSLSTSRKYSELARAAGKLGEFAQVLFPLIVVHADDFGRSSGDPFTVRHGIFPTSPRSLEAFGLAIDAMVRVGLLERWEADGRTVLAVVDFDAHQSGLHKRTRSRFPDPPGSSGNLPEIPFEEKRTERKRSEHVRTGPAPPAPAAPAAADDPADGLLEGLTATTPGAAVSEPSFGDFWQAWPPGYRVSKKQAADAWRKLGPVDRDRAIAEVRWRVDHDAAWQGPQPDGRWAIPHPHRYLRDRRFEDAHSPPPPPASSRNTAGNRAAHEAYVATLTNAAPGPDVYARAHDWCLNDPRCKTRHDPPCSTVQYHEILLLREAAAAAAEDVA